MNTGEQVKKKTQQKRGWQRVEGGAMRTITFRGNDAQYQAVRKNGGSRWLRELIDKAMRGGK